jgi:magnesium-dependent phosphatase 1
MTFSLIVFDLDFTLWNAGGTWCDHTFPPYRKERDYILDAENNKIILYPEVKGILHDLLDKGFKLGIASRTYEPAWARQLLELFEIDQFFSFIEIYPASKTEHFRQIRNKSGFSFSEMVFFDDEQRNVEDVQMLGVKAVLVRNGISISFLHKYLS